MQMFSNWLSQYANNYRIINAYYTVYHLITSIISTNALDKECIVRRSVHLLHVMIFFELGPINISICEFNIELKLCS
jgi:hypothetical protein